MFSPSAPGLIRVLALFEADDRSDSNYFNRAEYDKFLTTA